MSKRTTGPAWDRLSLSAGERSQVLPIEVACALLCTGGGEVKCSVCPFSQSKQKTFSNEGPWELFHMFKQLLMKKLPIRDLARNNNIEVSFIHVMLSHFNSEMLHFLS